ncbi:MAG TPA: hypothetical protein DHN33_05945 [Eubacteriaceae bacterium]|nr:hypothetical protein [Eubacteriaceae bacterium]
MDQINVSLQILPVVEEEHIYEVVDQVIRYIDSTGVKYVVGPMETTMEGNFDDLMQIVKEANEICFRKGIARVVSVVKIDAKKEGVTIDEKISPYR